MSAAGTPTREPHSDRGGLLRWRPRITFRTRLTLSFTALVTLAGTLMVISVNVFMRTVPTYLAANGTAVDEIVNSNGTATLATPTPEPAGEMPSQTVTISLQSPADILDTILIVSILVLLVLIAATALTSWLIAGRMLRPLQAVNQAAQLAGTGSFDHRVGLEGPRDELRPLSDTFDDMLQRLDRSFSASQRFAANASHELRTPLATTQTVLEVALADPEVDAVELRAAAERVLETNRRNIETVEALLDLAELDQREPASGAVDLSRLVRGALDQSRVELQARGLGVREDLGSDVVAQGDEILLRQAVDNLIRNSIRHNAPDGEVRVTTAKATHGRVSLRIENTGAALSEELVAVLTEPFVRGAGRTAAGPGGARGHGLGLAIVASVVRVHGGDLRLEARAGGGLIVEVDLPSAEAEK